MAFGRSASQHWRLANEACIIDLLDKKVRHVSSPGRWIRSDRKMGLAVHRAEPAQPRQLRYALSRRRRALARCAGLTGSPDESGRKRREKGLARSGNARVRRGMIQLAWRFLLHQKDSALTKWFRSRTENARGDVSIWELTGPSSGPFPNACSLCAMELDRLRHVCV